MYVLSVNLTYDRQVVTRYKTFHFPSVLETGILWANRPGCLCIPVSNLLCAISNNAGHTKSSCLVSVDGVVGSNAPVSPTRVQSFVVSIQSLYIRNRSTSPPQLSKGPVTSSGCDSVSPDSLPPNETPLVISK